MENILNNLNTFLSDLNVFYRKLQNYHWNIKGKDFFVIHSKLEEYYNEINTEIDELAEHILTLELTKDINEHGQLNITAIVPEEVATAMPLKMLVPTAEIISKGKSTRFPNKAVP